MKIKYKLAGSFVIVTLVSIVAVVYTYHAMMTGAIQKSYEYNARENAVTMADQAIQQMLEKSANYTGFLAKDTPLIQAAYYATLLGSPEDAERLMNEYQERLGLSFINLISPSGELVYSTHGDHHHTLSQGGAHHAIISFEPELKQLAIHAGAVIERNGKEVALLEGGYIFDRALLERLAGTDTVLALFSADADAATSSSDIEIDRGWVRSVFDEVAGACARDRHSELCRQPQFRMQRQFSRGVPYFMVATPIRITSEMPIGTLVVAEESLEMERELSAARNTAIAISGGGIAAALLIGMVLAQGLSHPIIKLKDAATAMGRGNLETRVNIEGSDELAILAQAFNGMGEALSGTTVSKNYMDNILRSMADALIVFDTAMQIKRINQATTKLFGYSEEELAGAPLERLFPDRERLEAILAALAEKGTVSHQETETSDRAGRRLQLSLSGALLHDSNQNVLGTVFVAQDVSERMQFLRELEKTNRQLDQFAYVVSHDLKAPLRAIANLSAWIEEDLADTMTADARQQMTLLRGRVHRMEALINGILDYSRIGRVAHDIETVDTAAMVAEIIDSLAVPEGMRIETGGAMPVIAAPRVPFSQVFSNLISNAIKYGRRGDGGKVEISVRDIGPMYEFAVADDGPGIDPKFHEKVFGMFQTLEARDKVESTGVGLCIVKKIVEEQGGTITLDSAAGKGATFRFTWPKQPHGQHEQGGANGTRIDSAVAGAVKS